MNRSICEMNDLDKYNYLIKNLNKLNEKNLLDIILGINDMDILEKVALKILKRFSFMEIKTVIFSLPDEVKMRILPKIYDDYHEMLLEMIKDDEIKIRYLERSEYANCYSSIVASLKNEDKILFYFDKYNSLIYKINVINKLKNEDIRIKLIEKLGNNDYKIMALSNYEPYIQILVNSRVSDMLNSFNNHDIDSDLTIGIELEVIHHDIDIFKNIHILLNNFRIKSEDSIGDGFEVVSPILHYNLMDMAKLSVVCNILNECHFSTKSTCGGHIHIGINHFKETSDLLNLLYIYCNCENIFYAIANRAGSKPRKQIDFYAGKIKKSLELAISKGDFDMVDDDLQSLLQVIKRIMIERYKGLNMITPYPTIEFRIPNGEIEFTELNYNIRLFLKLVQVSCSISKIDQDNQKRELFYKLKEHLPEDVKLNILLNLLFDNEEDKMIYRDRYYKNTNVFSRLIDNIYGVYFDKGIDFDDESRKNKVKRRVLE